MPKNGDQKEWNARTNTKGIIERKLLKRLKWRDGRCSSITSYGFEEEVES